jgi:hypothetical protein
MLEEFEFITLKFRAIPEVLMWDCGLKSATDSCVLLYTIKLFIYFSVSCCHKLSSSNVSFIEICN